MTGRSAACAPATATSPAAEPRRRLFTIFILNLQKSLSLRGFRVRPVRQHPLELPLAPRWPEKPFTPLGASCSPDSATGGCPPPSLSHISERTPLSNEEAPFPQVLTALFRRVLRKKHAVVNGLKLAFCLFQSGTIRFYFQPIRAILRLNWRGILVSTHPPSGVTSRPIEGYAHPGPGPVDAQRINFQADGGMQSEFGKPEHLAETQGFEPWIRL